MFMGATTPHWMLLEEWCTEKCRLSAKYAIGDLIWASQSISFPKASKPFLDAFDKYACTPADYTIVVTHPDE